MKIAMKKATIYTATLGCLLLPTIGLTATMEEVDQRLKQLEADVAVSREETDDLANRLKNNLSVTGYADVEYITTNKTATDDGFRMHHLSLFFSKHISEDWRFFSEIEFEDTPFYEPSKATNTTVTDSGGDTASVPNASTVGSGKIFAEAVNFDYQWRPDTSLRAGRFFTPAGLWSVDHYPPFVSTQERPLHIRNIFPQLVDGAAISGNHPVGSAFFNYNLYVGNGETTRHDGSKDSNSTKSVGLRMALSLPFAQQLEVGVSTYRDKLADTVITKKNAWGAHAKFRQGAFEFQSEYAKGKYEPTVTPTTNLPYHRKGYYTQFSYDISKWTLGYRFDYYDPKTTAPNDATKINSAFINYHVDKNIVLKWEHHLINVENPASQDHYKDIASIVVYLD